MTPERWQRVQALFDSAVEKPESEVDEFVRAECAGDSDLYLEVRRMLNEHARTGFLDRPPGAVIAKAYSLELGSILSGRYRLLRPLGRGGMGEVYEAEDLELKELVALKTLIPEIAADGRMVARFKQEVRITRKISHPHVCRVFDLARHPADSSAPDAVLFLTMELLEGESLAQRLRQGRMTAADALPLVLQMAQALDAAHREGIIHRDFKPSNVMLTDAHGAVVTDFGLARRAAMLEDVTATISGQLMGTIDYMAPELFTGAEATAASDIYALGLVMYEMVTGRKPFPGETPFQSAMKRLNEAPASPAEFVPELEPRWAMAILRCLERDPARRFASAGEVELALTDSGSLGDSTAGRIPEGGRRKMVRAVAAAAIGAVILAAGFAGAWELGRHRPPAQAVRWYEQGIRALRDGTSYTAMTALQRAVAFDPDFALAHARLAEAATDLDYMDKARSEMLRAYPPGYQSFFLTGEEKLRLQAAYFVLVRDFVRAAAKYKELAGKVSADRRAAVLVDLGRVYEGDGKIQEAIASYSESIALDNQFAAAFLRRAVLEGRQQQNAKAATDFDTAEQIYNAAGNAEGNTEVLYQRSSLLRRTGKLAEARVPAEAALELARHNHDDYHQIRALLMLSYLRYNSGDVEGGQQRAREAVEMARRAGIEILATSGLIDIGNALFNKGDYAGAEPYLRNAIETAGRFQAVRVEARAELTLGQLLVNQGRTAEGSAISKRAIEDFERAGDKSNAARAAVPAARALRDQGDYSAAAGLFRDQLELAGRVNDNGGIAFAAQGLGSVLLMQEQYPAALANFERAAEVSHSTGDLTTEAYCDVSRADALRALGKYNEAAESLHAAELINKKLNGNKPLMASVSFSRAQLNLSQLRFADVEEDLRQMRDAAGTGLFVPSEKRLKGLLRLATGRIPEGLALCKEALQSSGTLHNVPLLKNLELALAQAKLLSGDGAGALALSSRLAQYFHEKGQQESELRALTIAISASREPDRTRYVAGARVNVAALKQSLGQAFTSFAGRPDIQQMMKHTGLDVY